MYRINEVIFGWYSLQRLRAFARVLLLIPKTTAAGMAIDILMTKYDKKSRQSQAKFSIV
jgi:hypothetical protein